MRPLSTSMRQLQSQVTVRAQATGGEGAENLGVDEKYQVPDELWNRMQALLPPPPNHKRKDRPGRPRMDDRKAMNAIFYVLRTGCQWNAPARLLGASSTVHDRFEERGKPESSNGSGRRDWSSTAKKGARVDWQSMDGVITKEPLGGEGTGPNPTDRAKSGTKRSLLVEGNGIPIAVDVDGANTHDMKLTGRTPENIVIERPKPASWRPQNICLDKGFDFPEVDELVAACGSNRPHREKRGRLVEEAEDPGISGEEVSLREDPLVDEPVQEAPHQVGGEEKELCRDVTLCMRVDYLAGGRATGKVIIRTGSNTNSCYIAEACNLAHLNPYLVFDVF